MKINCSLWGDCDGDFIFSIEARRELSAKETTASSVLLQPVDGIDPPVFLTTFDEKLLDFTRSTNAHSEIRK